MNVNNKRVAITLILSGIGLLSLMFQNMTLVEFSTLNMPEIDESSRRDQARELLGTFYKGSLAEKFEGEQYLNYLIYKKIESSMGPEWGAWAAQITQTLIDECKKRELDPIFVLAIIQTESRFNSRAKGSRGEVGLMQILPRTGEWISKKYKIPWNGDNTLYDPITNIKVGIAYFSYLRSDFESRAHHYVPAYNMGPKNMRKISRTINSIDSTSQPGKGEYTQKVLKNYSQIYQEIANNQRVLIKFAQSQKSDILTR